MINISQINDDKPTTDIVFSEIQLDKFLPRWLFLETLDHLHEIREQYNDTISRIKYNYSENNKAFLVRCALGLSIITQFLYHLLSGNFLNNKVATTISLIQLFLSTHFLLLKVLFQRKSCFDPLIPPPSVSKQYDIKILLALLDTTESQPVTYRYDHEQAESYIKKGFSLAKTLQALKKVSDSLSSPSFHLKTNNTMDPELLLMSCIIFYATKKKSTRTDRDNTLHLKETLLKMMQKEETKKDIIQQPLMSMPLLQMTDLLSIETVICSQELGFHTDKNHANGLLIELFKKKKTALLCAWYHTIHNISYVNGDYFIALLLITSRLLFQLQINKDFFMNALENACPMTSLNQLVSFLYAPITLQATNTAQRLIFSPTSLGLRGLTHPGLAFTMPTYFPETPRPIIELASRGYFYSNAIAQLKDPCLKTKETRTLNFFIIFLMFSALIIAHADKLAKHLREFIIGNPTDFIGLLLLSHELSHIINIYFSKTKNPLNMQDFIRKHFNSDDQTKKKNVTTDDIINNSVLQSLAFDINNQKKSDLIEHITTSCHHQRLDIALSVWHENTRMRYAELLHDILSTLQEVTGPMSLDDMKRIINNVIDHCRKGKSIAERKYNATKSRKLKNELTKEEINTLTENKETIKTTLKDFQSIKALLFQSELNKMAPKEDLARHHHLLKCIEQHQGLLKEIAP